MTTGVSQIFVSESISVAALPRIHLTAKQRAFCDEWIKDSNGKQAAIRARYSEKTVAVKTTALLTELNVSA